MSAPIFSQEEFTSAFQRLLPRGHVWPRDPDAIQTKFWSAMSPTYVRQMEAAAGLLQDSPPFLLNQLLPEWEATLGLPDPCAGDTPSFSQRVAQVQAKLFLAGGQTVAYFLALATALGYPDVTITEYAPARCGRAVCGDPCAGEPWAHVWLVTAPNIPVSYAVCDLARCGDPLYSIAADELKCNIDRYAPAHTVVLYAGHV